MPRGAVVLVVAPNQREAMQYIAEMEQIHEEYQFRYIDDVTGGTTMRPPMVVRIDKVEGWEDVAEPHFVRWVRQLENEIEYFKRRVDDSLGPRNIKHAGEEDPGDESD